MVGLGVLVGLASPRFLLPTAQVSGGRGAEVLRVRLFALRARRACPGCVRGAIRGSVVARARPQGGKGPGGRRGGAAMAGLE